VVRKPATTVSPASSVVSVEVIEGDKKKEVKFDEQGSAPKGSDTK
jgi:hypothetical protein